MIGLEHYLAVAAALFVIGIFGLFLNRKNVIILLMSIELILLAVNINFVAFSAHLNDLVGQVFTLFVQVPDFFDLGVELSRFLLQELVAVQLVCDAFLVVPVHGSNHADHGEHGKGSQRIELFLAFATEFVAPWEQVNSCH